MNQNNIFQTSDLALAAYMVTKGMRLLKAERKPSGRYHFEIEDPDRKADEYKMEFINSEFYKFDNNLKTLKKMVYSWGFMFRYLKEIKDYFVNKVKSFYYFFVKIEDDAIILPCIGDIVEYDDGKRVLVLSVTINSDHVEVHYSNGVGYVTDKKGRSQMVLLSQKESQVWPPANSKVIRDGTKIFPISNFRLSIIQIIEKIFR